MKKNALNKSSLVTIILLGVTIGDSVIKLHIVCRLLYFLGPWFNNNQGQVLQILYSVLSL